MKTTIRISCLCLLVISVFSGCYYDVESELYPATTNAGCDTANVTYSTVIQPMITSNCAISGCHVAGAQLPDLSGFAGLSASIDRVTVRSITEKTMPPSGPLSSCDLTKLQVWISAGALNN